ncbi:MAG: o-succinylbenzoate synthase [Salinirussus sp.]
MRIDRFQLELTAPLRTAGGTIDRREGFIVRVDHDGATGVGEATPLPGWTESLDACRTALERAERVASELDWGIALARLDAPAARHGLALALADARARTASIPLYRALGGDSRVEEVPVNGTIGDGTVDTCRDQARRLVDAGVPAIKLKVGARTLAADRRRIAAVRDAIGSDVELRLDANGAWDWETAAAATDAATEYAVSYIEQPLPASDLAGLEKLRGSGVGIAVDETLVEHDLSAVVEAGAADVIICKPMVLGGPDRTVALADDAQAAGLEAIVTTTVDAAVARTAAVHVAATLPGVAPCGLATGDRLTRDVCSDPAPILDGAAAVPQGPGLGLPEEPRP